MITFSKIIVDVVAVSVSKRGDSNGFNCSTTKAPVAAKNAWCLYDFVFLDGDCGHADVGSSSRKLLEASVC